MTRCCGCMAAGALLGVLIVTVTGALPAAEPSPGQFFMAS